MNPAVEKYMESIQTEQRIKEQESNQTDVSDEQMTVQWQKIRGKFEAAQKRKNVHHTDKTDEPIEKKPKFLKPVD